MTRLRRLRELILHPLVKSFLAQKVEAVMGNIKIWFGVTTQIKGKKKSPKKERRKKDEKMKHIRKRKMSFPTAERVHENIR